MDYLKVILLHILLHRHKQQLNLLHKKDKFWNILLHIVSKFDILQGLKFVTWTNVLLDY